MKKLLPIVIFFIICTSPLSAIEKEKDDIFGMSVEELMDVNVSVASMFLENEMVVGSSVAGIGPATWESLGARRLHEALRKQTSVVPYYTLGGSAVLAVRGYATNTSARGIALLLDDVPLNSLSFGTAFYQMPSWNLMTLNKIELITGPGSAIYGSDAFHGVLSLKTFESDEDLYSVKTTVGYPCYHAAGTNLSRGLADNSLRVDLAAGYNKQGDQNISFSYDDPNGYPPLGIPPESGEGERKQEYDTTTAILKIRYQPTDKLQLKTGGYYNYWQAEEFPGFYTNGPYFLHANDYTHDEGSSIKMCNASLSYSIIKNIILTSSGYYAEMLNGNTYNMDPEIDDFILIPHAVDSRSGFNLFIKQPDNPFHLQWLVGYSYSDMKIDEAYLSLMSESGVYHPLQIPKREVLFSGMHRYIHSGLCQFKWGMWPERLFFLAGGRADDYSDAGMQLTPRAGIIFLPTESSAVKALYGQAFRAPMGSELTAGEPSIIGNPDIEPETIDNYELIYIQKKENWRFEGTLFYSLWKDGITADDIDIPVEKYGREWYQQYVNKTRSRSIGGELQAFVKRDPFAVDFSVTYVKSEELDVDDPDDPDGTIDQRYVAYPTYVTYVGFHYNMDPIDTSFLLNIRGEFDRKEGPLNKDATPDDLDDYVRVDLNMEKSVSEKLKLSLDIRNLFNDKNLASPSVWGAEGGNPEDGISGCISIGYLL